MRETCPTCGGHISRHPGYNAGTCEEPEWTPEEIHHDDPDDAEFCRLITESLKASTR